MLALTQLRSPFLTINILFFNFDHAVCYKSSKKKTSTTLRVAPIELNLRHNKSDVNSIMVGETCSSMTSCHAWIPVDIGGDLQSDRPTCSSPSCERVPDVVDPATLLGVLCPCVGVVAPGVVLHPVLVPRWKSSI